jgi:signal transduction histidine kinase
VDTLLGWISASGREEEVSFGEADRRLLDAMASHAGASLAKAQVEGRLRQEIAHSEELLRSKDQLIAAVSHELRTPLTGILGFAEIMRQGETGLDTATQQEIAASIAGEALDLSFIVEDLLTAARFDLGQLTVRPHAVEVADLIEAVLEPIEQRTGRRFDRHVREATAWTDGARARQILRNLVANAVKYGGERIEVRVAQLGGLVAVEVCDDGTTLDPSDAERIFLPYQTAHESSTQPGSVGLGLAISRELARLSGGDVMHVGRPGWTVFRFTMPAEPFETPTDGPASGDPAGVPTPGLVVQPVV